MSSPFSDPDPLVLDTADQDEEARLHAWVAAAQAGDHDALERVVAAVQPMVRRRCARFFTFRADAEDAAQEALLAISSKIGSFRPERGRFPAWATVVAANSARSTYRSLRRRFNEHSAEVLPEALDPRTTSVIAGSRVDLMEALEELEAQRPAVVEAFVLRDIGSLPYEEIATLLDTPLGTIKARIHDARQFMRQRLAVTG